MDFKGLVTVIINNIFRPLGSLIFALAVIYFLLGVLKYIQSAESEEKRKEGRDMMVYGIVALFVMSALWGLVTVLQNTFPLNNTPINPPSTTGDTVGFPGGQAGPPSR